MEMWWWWWRENNRNVVVVMVVVVEGKQLTTPENTMTYHNALCLSPQNFEYAMSSVSPGATNKEHYGMLWYFLGCSIPVCTQVAGF